MIDPKINVTSADIYHDFLENAQLNAEANNLKIEFIQTDMFKNIKDKYDLITFNPPLRSSELQEKDIEYDKISFATEVFYELLVFF